METFASVASSSSNDNEILINESIPDFVKNKTFYIVTETKTYSYETLVVSDDPYCSASVIKNDKTSVETIYWNKKNAFNHVKSLQKEIINKLRFHEDDLKWNVKNFGNESNTIFAEYINYNDNKFNRKYKTCSDINVNITFIVSEIHFND